MCMPKIPKPAPIPDAPPPPSKTATSIKTKGSTSPEAAAAGEQSASRSGTDQLRVDLAIPDAQDTVSNGGGFGSLLAKLF